MAELILLKNGKCDLKFHAPCKKFKRVEKFSYKKNFFKLFVDKNDSIYDVKRCEVTTWKTIEKGKKTINVPDRVEEKRDTYLFDKVKGNPYTIAAAKIMAEIKVNSEIYGG